MIRGNQAPTYVEVTSADGAGRQVVGRGHRVIIVAAQIEGGGTAFATFRSTNSGGAIIGVLLGNLVARADTPASQHHKIESQDGLYVGRSGYSKLRLWLISAGPVT